jgi:hypothetical protein
MNGSRAEAFAILANPESPEFNPYTQRTSWLLETKFIVIISVVSPSNNHHLTAYLYDKRTNAHFLKYAQPHIIILH